MIEILRVEMEQKPPMRRHRSYKRDPACGWRNFEWCRENVAMAMDGDQPLPAGPSSVIGRPSPSSLIRTFVDRVRVRGFFNALGMRRAPFSDEARNTTSGGPEQNMMRASEYLEICQENALDAHTIEDALYWHNEIITELSIELNLIHTTRWPATVKSNMAAAVEERLSQHAAAVTRLAAVLETNEAFRWQP